MKNKKIIFPLLLLTLTLAGCQGKSEDTSRVVSEDPASTSVEDVTSTDESSAQVATSIDMIEEGYTLSEGWPKVAIDDYLEGLGVEERVPAFTTEKETYYAIYEDPFVFQQLITEVAIIDTTMESTTALHDFLVAEGWTNTSNLEEKYIQFYNPTETIVVMGGIYAGDEEFPAMSLFYIAGFVNKAPLEGYETTTGWPETVINEYLAGYGITDVTVPALNVTDEAFVKLVDDDPNFDPYLSLVVPGGNRVEEYKGILTAGGFPVEADDEDPDYFYAENAAQNVLVEFFYAEAEAGYPEGMYIFVSGFGTQQGGEVEKPSNPESAKVITLRDESHMQGERNAEKTTWGLEGLKMEVTKNTSNENVGNLIPSQPDKHFFSNPLRVYKGQKVTFTATEQIEQVHFEFDKTHTSTLDSLIASVPAGVSYAVEDNIFVIAANSNTLEFSFVAAAQFRIFGVTVYTNKA